MKKLYVEGANYKTAVPAPYTTHYVYAHGLLESKAHYDIVCAAEDDFNFRDDRVEEVVAVLPDGTEMEAVLFFWHEFSETDDIKYDVYVLETMKEEPVYRCHGRLVAQCDIEAIEQASRRMLDEMMASAKAKASLFERIASSNSKTENKAYTIARLAR